MIWTLISAVMSSLLYQLSYSLYIYEPESKIRASAAKQQPIKIMCVRTKDLHPYLLDMSQLCYYYTNPHLLFRACATSAAAKQQPASQVNKIKILLASEGIEPSHVMMKTLCLNHLTIRPLPLLIRISYINIHIYKYILWLKQ